MKTDWEIKKQNLEGRTPSTCEAGVSPLQTSSLPQHALKAGWEIKKLGEVCEFLDSRRKPITANKRTKGPIPYYGATGILDYVADFLFDEELILLGEDGAKWGPGDKSAFRISGKTWVNNHAHVLKPKNMNYDWIIYYLNYSDLMKFVKGATVPKLNQENAKNISIPVPPLEEQKRIVKILDEKFAQLETIKANAQTNLQNAKDLFQSKLASIFEQKDCHTDSGLLTQSQKKDFKDFPLGKSNPCGNNWKTVQLGDCGTFKNGMNFSSIDSGYKIHSLGVGDFKNLFEISDTAQLSEISLKSAPSEDYLLQDGDIVFVRSNGNKELVGRCLLVYPGNVPTTYSGFCIRFRKMNDSIDSNYLLHFLKSEKARKILNGKEGANISNLNQKILGDFEVPVPPLEEQKRIVKELDALSEKVYQLQEIYTKQIANCDELKQAYLQKAFEGEL